MRFPEVYSLMAGGWCLVALVASWSYRFFGRWFGPTTPMHAMLGDGTAGTIADGVGVVGQAGSFIVGLVALVGAARAFSQAYWSHRERMADLDEFRAEVGELRQVVAANRVWMWEAALAHKELKLPQGFGVRSFDVGSSAVVDVRPVRPGETGDYPKLTPATPPPEAGGVALGQDFEKLTPEQRAEVKLELVRMINAKLATMGPPHAGPAAINHPLTPDEVEKLRQAFQESAKPGPLGILPPQDAPAAPGQADGLRAD